MRIKTTKKQQQNIWLTNYAIPLHTTVCWAVMCTDSAIIVVHRVFPFHVVDTNNNKKKLKSNRKLRCGKYTLFDLILLLSLTKCRMIRIGNSVMEIFYKNFPNFNEKIFFLLSLNIKKKFKCTTIYWNCLLLLLFFFSITVAVSQKSYTWNLNEVNCSRGSHNGKTELKKLYYKLKEI